MRILYITAMCCVAFPAFCETLKGHEGAPDKLGPAARHEPLHQDTDRGMQDGPNKHTHDTQASKGNAGERHGKN